jgi:hypothetical protein
MSQAGDATVDLINSFNEKISKVAPGAVGTQSNKPFPIFGGRFSSVAYLTLGW